ncbi:MAG: hypothetical protein U0230_26005 [Polyangiales bacterium]
MPSSTLAPHVVNSVARRLLHEDASEACLVERLSAEQWMTDEPTRLLARSLELEDALPHVAALVWSGWSLR